MDSKKNITFGKLTEQQGKRGVDALITLGLKQNNDLDRLLVVAGEAKELSTTLGYDRGLAQSLLLLCRYHAQTGNNSEAAEAANSAYGLFLLLGDSAGQAEALYWLGSAYCSLEDYDEALECIRKGLNIIGDNDLAMVLRGLFADLKDVLSAVYCRQGRYGEALAVLLETLEQAEEAGGAKLATLYTTISEYYMKNGSYDTALLYSQQAMLEGAKHSLGSAHQMICDTLSGMILEQSGQPEKALASYKNALVSAIATNSKYAVAHALLAIGSMQLYLKDIPNAQLSLNKALDIARECNAGELARAAHSRLVDWYDSPDNAVETGFAANCFVPVADIGLEDRLAMLRKRANADGGHLDAEIYHQINAELKRKGEEVKSLRRDMEEQTRYLAALAEIGQGIAQSGEPDKIAEPILAGIHRLFDADILAFGTYNEAASKMEYSVLMESGKRLPPQKTAMANEPIKALRSGRDVLYNDIKPADALRLAIKAAPNSKLPRSALYCPVTPHSQATAVLTVQSYNPDAYDNNDSRLLRVLAQYVAIALNNTQKSEELRAKERELAQAIRTDQLTGLFNRRDMIERMEDECVRSQRSRKAFSLVLAEVDQLKAARDSQGQECSDNIIKAVARLLRPSIRKQDLLGKWSDDQFLILLPETDANGATLLCEKLRKKLQKQAFTSQEVELAATLTCGLTEYNNVKSLDATIKAAESALLAAKLKGRNCVEKR